jgi:hypothetical protein
MFCTFSNIQLRTATGSLVRLAPDVTLAVPSMDLDALGDALVAVMGAEYQGASFTYEAGTAGAATYQWNLQAMTDTTTVYPFTGTMGAASDAAQALADETGRSVNACLADGSGEFWPDARVGDFGSFYPKGR